MSTVFYTEPQIEYAVFLAACQIETNPDALKPFPVSECLGRPGCGGYIWVSEGPEGEAVFERFGANSPEYVFTNILNKFPIAIFDEFGLEWPLESGG